MIVERGPWAALGSTAGFALLLAHEIDRRSALSMDELHTVLLARLFRAGAVPSIHVGAVTDYEAGSWFIGWPVAALAGLGDTAAASWGAGGIALLSVFLGSLWLHRHAGWRAGLLLGPLLGLALPEYLRFAHQPWGSVPESLLLLPVLALALDAWDQRGRPLVAAPGLGLLLAFAIVLSWFHMVTALAFLAMQGRGRSRQTLLVGGTALLAFAGWVVLTRPDLGDGLSLRAGRSLLSTLPDLLFVRLDRIAGTLPAAWAGERTEFGAAVRAAGLGLSLLSAVALVRLRGHPVLRRVSLFALVCLPAVSVGHGLAEAPEVHRYYLPLLGAGLVAIAAWGWRATGLACLLALAFRVPDGLPVEGQQLHRSHLELGAFALLRAEGSPHRKFVALRSVTEPRFRPWLACGYGRDSGLRYGPTRGVLQAILDEGVPPEVLQATHVEAPLASVGGWLDFWEGPPWPADRGTFLRCFGAELAADGALDATDCELVEALDPVSRIELLGGVGAGAQVRGMSELDAPPRCAPVEPLGLGARAVRRPGEPLALGLPDSARAPAPNRALRAMLDLTLPSTPQPRRGEHP